ncbi:hypothetical protein ACWEVP_13545 [Amycolatopsis sp. NPDC003865]
MRGRYWLPVVYALVAGGLWLATGYWPWLLWAVPIALFLTTALMLSGYSSEFTVRRRWREMRKLADRIGARDGEPVRESRRRWAVIGHQASMNFQTIRPGTETEVRRALVGKATAAGYARTNSGYFRTARGKVLLGISVRRETAYPIVIPEGHVHVEISMIESMG